MQNTPNIPVMEFNKVMAFFNQKGYDTANLIHYNGFEYISKDTAYFIVKLAVLGNDLTKSNEMYHQVRLAQNELGATITTYVFQSN